MAEKILDFYVKKMQKSFIVLIVFGLSAFVFAGCTRKGEETLMLMPLEDVAEEETFKVQEDAADVSEEDTLKEEIADLICVHVCGAVNNPGVYELKQGSRVFEAVELAGGFAEDASQDFVNMAQELSDALRLYIPTVQEAQAWEGQNEVSDGKDADGLININTADKEQLCTLPGIGEAKAEAVIAYRQLNGKFESKEQIMEIDGIKEAMFSKIKDKICVR